MDFAAFAVLEIAVGGAARASIRGRRARLTRLRSAAFAVLGSGRRDFRRDAIRPSGPRSNPNEQAGRPSSAFVHSVTVYATCIGCTQ